MEIAPREKTKGTPLSVIFTTEEELVYVINFC